MEGVNGFATNTGDWTNSVHFQPVDFQAGATTATSTVSLALANVASAAVAKDFGLIVQRAQDSNANNHLAQTNFTISATPVTVGTVQHGFDIPRTESAILVADAAQLKTSNPHYDFAALYIGRNIDDHGVIGGDPSQGYLTLDQANELQHTGGIKLVSLYEKDFMYDTDKNGNHTYQWESYFANTAGGGAEKLGEADAKAAYEAATQVAHQTAGSAIYFALDINPADLDTTGQYKNVISDESAALKLFVDYFRGINNYLSQQSTKYSVGVYGAGATLSAILDPAAIEPGSDGSPLAQYFWAVKNDWAGNEDWGAVGSGKPHTYNLIQTNIHVSDLLFGQIKIDLDQSSGLPSYGAWGDAVISATAPQPNPINGGGAQNVVTVNGDSSTTTHMAVTADGDYVSVTNTDLGKLVAQAIQFGEMVFNNIKGLIVGALNGTGILGHTVYFNGADGGNNLDASATDTSVVATGGNGNDILVGASRAMCSMAAPAPTL